MIGEMGYTTSPRNGGMPVDIPGAKRSPEVSIEMGRIEEALSILDKCLGDHYQRLQPILRQEPPTDTNRLCGAADEHRASALGGALQQMRYKIERMTQALSATSALIEV